jgi:AbrB family looped-hinge helix DNA binding protein
MSEPEDGTTVTVTSKGQATIPKEFRDKLQIDTPGRVRFVENENGEIVVRPVKRPSELRGALASEDEADMETPEKPATELLREQRERDKQRTDEKHELTEQDE